MSWDRFWENVEPVDGAYEFLQLLQNDKDIELYIVTATFPTTPRTKFERFFTLFPFILPQQIIQIHDKSMLNIDCLVDDKYDNLTKGDYDKILYTRPHNEKYVDKGVNRVYNLDEAYKLIELFKKRG